MLLESLDNSCTRSTSSPMVGGARLTFAFKGKIFALMGLSLWQLMFTCQYGRYY